LAVKGLPIDLFNRGRTLHDALHVSEVVEAIKSCLRCPTRIGSRRLNLGCGRPVTAFEYANTLTEALGSSSQLVPVDHRPASTCDLYADIRNAQREIGFEPQPLAVTMRKYADELRSGY
jgi:nucleoside-diphosphate-sugar epimerase